MAEMGLPQCEWYYWWFGEERGANPPNSRKSQGDLVLSAARMFVCPGIVGLAMVKSSCLEDSQRS